MGPFLFSNGTSEISGNLVCWWVKIIQCNPYTFMSVSGRILDRVEYCYTYFQIKEFLLPDRV